ncbi:hypothetical protein ACQP1S_21555 [Micromonospora matsumotoense]|uniref:hypothetical protein n=1 Tax=Micromonospora matsumotoense TaxID=121616 RepID=UPI003D90EFA0
MATQPAYRRLRPALTPGGDRNGLALFPSLTRLEMLCPANTPGKDRNLSQGKRRLPRGDGALRPAITPGEDRNGA